MGVVGLSNLVVFCLIVCGGINEASAESARKKVVIEGSVKCVYCVMEGGPGSVSKTALLPGAVVKVQCNNTNKAWEEKTTTDSKGRYVLKPEKVTTWGAHKCKLFLVSSPRPDCPVILYSDSFGFPFKPNTTANTDTAPFYRYTLPDLAFFPGPFMCL